MLNFHLFPSRRPAALALTLLAVLTSIPRLEAQEPEENTIPQGYVQLDCMCLPEHAVRGDSNWTAIAWPGSVVFFQFHSSIPGYRRDLFMKAIWEIEAISQVNFIESPGAGSYVRIINNANSSNVSYSSVGFMGGVQDLAVGANHWDDKYILVHELFHALGFLHEQSRPDRDTYVTINFQNISQTGCSGNPCDGNFVKVNSATMVGAYDFSSIMHYRSNAFSSNGQPTIVAKPAYAQSQTLMGNRTFMTDSDANGIQARYGQYSQPSTTAVSPSSVTAGSGPITITVTGTRFFEGSPTSDGIQGTRVRFNFQVLDTTFISNTTVQAVVPASLLDTVGTFNVDVVQDCQAGCNSPAGVNFQVTYPPCNSQNDRVGTSVEGLGDVNGDGFDDYAVGSPGRGSGGGITVYSGFNGAAIWSYNGPSSSFTGNSLSAMDDITGDGRKELLVGAPYYNTYAGRITLHNGSTGSILATLNYGTANSEFGRSVAAVGDSDGDGDQDFLVGVPSYNNFAGRVELWSTNGGLMRAHNGVAANDFFGWSIAGGEDCSGDGRPDYVVGAYMADGAGGLNSGRVTWYSGATGSVLASREGDGISDYFGYSVAMCPPLTAWSGRANTLVGAPDFGDLFANNAGPGYVRVFSGFGSFGLPSFQVVYEWTGVNDGEHYGRSVACGGDADDDGKPDVIIGAIESGIGAQPPIGPGYADVRSGATGLRLHKERYTNFVGPVPSGIEYGWDVAVIGDIDGDCHLDYIAGVPFSDSPCPNTGDIDIFEVKVPPVQNRVLITEVTSGNPDGVEITNFGTANFSLTNWTVVWKDGARLTSSPINVTLLPGQSIIVAEPNATFPEAGTTQVLDILPTINTTTGDFAVALVAPNGFVLDEVHVPSAVTGFYLEGSLGGKFRGLVSNVQSGPVYSAIHSERIWGLDSNAGRDWTSHQQRSMGLENSGAGRRGTDPIVIPRVRINEIDDSPDYIEIYNAHSSNVDMRNWYLTATAIQGGARSIIKPNFTTGLLFGLMATTPPLSYCVLGDAATVPAEKPSNVPYINVATTGPGIPFTTSEYECALYDYHGRLVDLVRSTQMNTNVVFNHPRCPSHWADFTAAAQRVSGGESIIHRNASGSDYNTGDDWRSSSTRTMGTQNGGPITWLPATDRKINVVLSDTALGGGLTMIVNAGTENAGQLWSFAFSYGHLNGSGPILGLGPEATQNWLLFSTTPPWFGNLDDDGMARLDVAPGSIAGVLDTDDIFLLQDASTLAFIDLTYVLEFDLN